MWMGMTIATRQSLQLFVKGITEKRGVDKNLWAKKFIKEIQYSESDIQINLYYSNNYENLNPSDFSGRSEKIQRKTAEPFSSHDSDFSVCDKQNGGAFQNASNYISIILPNTIHRCKKRNLRK